MAGGSASRERSDGSSGSQTGVQPRSRSRSRSGSQSGSASEHRNEVVLRGRLAATAEQRELPSGDVMATFRLVVDRPPGRRTRAESRSPTVDTLDCVAWRADVRRAARSWVAGSVLEVTGALRRRFWRTAGGAASRCEVEVTSARVVAVGG